MASWKKVIVSGSGAHLASVTASNLTDDRLVYSDNGGILLSSNVQINAGGHLVGQFSGSHEHALTDGNGIANFSYDGGAAASVAVEVSGSTLTVGAAGVAVSAAGITNAEMAANSVDTDQYVDDSIEFVHLSGSSIVTGAEGITAANTGSDDNIPTTKAVKDYVDNQLGGSDLDISDGTNTDAIDLDSETLTFTGGGGITATVSTGTVTFGATVSELGGGLISGSSQVVAALPAGTVSGSSQVNANDITNFDSNVKDKMDADGVISGSAQIRPLFSAVDTTGAAGIDMSYNSTNGQFSGSLVNSTIGFAADGGSTQEIGLGSDLTITGGTNITTAMTAGTVTINLDSAPTGLAASGSFSGSFEGDGSGLTGIATTLNIDVKDNASDSADDVDIDLQTETLTIQGTANEVDAQGSGNIITIGLPQDVTVARDLTVTRDLTVLGDTTTLSTTNLLVEDAFILVASGSTGAVDGGIIVDGGDNNGEGLVYDTDAQTDGRWGFASSLSDGANSADLTAAGTAFAAAVIDMNESHTDIAKYQKAGNIKIDTNEDIYIYS